MDCIYKTNKFSIPIFNVIGMISFNTFFTIVITFIQEESKIYYL